MLDLRLEKVISLTAANCQLREAVPNVATAHLGSALPTLEGTQLLKSSRAVSMPQWY